MALLIDRAMAVFDTLSPRERECLSLLARPMRPKEIAAELNLSVKTIETYLAAAKGKLGATSPIHAARLYNQHREAVPENPPGDFPRVEEPRFPTPDAIGPTVSSTAPQGREIKLDWRFRSGIIIGLSFVMILSVLVIVAGAEAITRLAHGYYAAPSSNPH